MRPIELTMSAFGPYAGKKTIPFETLGTNGLYLITGDTGAGKTTIFDAISYALFGEATSSKRQDSMLRSTFADPAEETFVELTFEYKGEKYRVKRNPSYERAKKSGNGTTKESAAVEFEKIGGDRAPKTRIAEVNNEIIKLLGVNHDQFSQIAMIAQGDFLKLLLADTKTRIEIFRKLFKTERFDSLQKRLKDEVNALRAQTKDIKRDIENAVNGVKIYPDSELYPVWQSRTNTESAITILEDIIRADEKKQKALREQIRKLDEELQGLKAKEELGKQQQRKQNDLEKAKAAYGKLEPEISGLAESCAQAKAKLPEADRLLAEAAALGEKLSDYDKLAGLKMSAAKRQAEYSSKSDEKEQTVIMLAELENSLAGKKEELKTLADAELKLAEVKSGLRELADKKNSLKELSDAINAVKAAELKAAAAETGHKQADDLQQKAQQLLHGLQEEQQKLDKAGEILLSLRNEAEKLADKKALMDKLIAACKEYSVKLKKVEKMQEELTQKAEAHWSANSAYEKAYGSFLAGQAGILASMLKPGIACSVCGSLAHPAPAALDESVPSADELKALKKELESTDEEAKKAAEAVKVFNERLDSDAEKLQDQAEKLGISANVDELADAAARANKALLEEIAGNSAKLKKAESDNKRSEMLKEDIRRQSELAEQRTRAANDAKNALTAALTELRNKKEAAVQAASKILPGVPETDIAAELEKEKQAVDHEGRRLAAEQRMQQQRADRRNNLEKELPGCETGVENSKNKIIGLAEAIASLGAELNSLEEQKKELAARLPFAEKSEAEKTITAKTIQAKNIKTAADRADESLKTAKEKLNTLAGSINILEKQLAAEALVDLIALYDEQKDAETAKKALQDESTAVTATVSRNNDCLSTLKDRARGFAETEKKLKLLEPLSDTANGEVSGKAKITLETFAQMAVFDNVIDHANSRFSMMTSGQFELVRRAEADTKSGKFGLDLDVIDHHNGSTRAVGSLSGGESFMASLSLALGLSDVIQEQAGGIQIDTMFVDEGFGSLDDETLKLAIKALESLSNGNKLVGLISHVPELQRRIHPQIVVKKSAAGDSNAYIELD